jgi:hypothetical protein
MAKTHRTEQPAKTNPAVVAGAAKAKGLTEEERRRMIAETAYYLAERRGFVGGSPEQDWLEAEAQIDRMLGGKAH